MSFFFGCAKPLPALEGGAKVYKSTIGESEAQACRKAALYESVRLNDRQWEEILYRQCVDEILFGTDKWK